MMHISQVTRAGQTPDAPQATAVDTATDQARWDAVMRRDRSADGAFVYAVTSTGVYCRPSCASRRPRRDRARFFSTPAAAEHAGFRACRRCHPASSAPAPSLSDAIARATTYLARHADDSISLARLAAMARVSPSHFQRQFKQALGVSPREYQAACRAERFRAGLRSGRDVTSAMYEAGYGSPSRIYESSPTGRGMPPATYRRGGKGTEIGYTVVRCALGWLLVAATTKGVCAVTLGDSASALERELRREFPAATLQRDAIVPAAWVQSVIAQMNGGNRDHALPLDVRGTAFQWRVWRALQTIPVGETRSYSEIAHAIGRPAAVRAVARACATNPVCLVIPCHRVVAKNGETGGYRWGVARKRRLLDREATSSARPAKAQKAK